MAEFDIDLNKAINDFKKLDDTVANMLKNAESLVAKLNNTPQAKPLVGANSKILKDVELQAKAITKMYQDMQKQSATLNAVIDKSTQGYIQNTQAMKAQTAEQRLHLAATNEQLPAIERLIAEQKIAANTAVDMGIKYGTTDQRFISSAKHARDLGAKISDLEQATGRFSSRTKNGYPAVFSFSQVLREMPNFAMSARIGFMSLSNNIPMLADDFVRLKKTMDDTGKKIIGTKGAIKILAKELIGFNGIVILATTLVTMFAMGGLDKLIDKFKELFDSTNAATRAQLEYNKAMDDAEGKANKFKEDITQTITALKAATSGLSTYVGTSLAEKEIKTWEDASRAIAEYEKYKTLLPKKSVDLIEKKGLSDIQKANVIIREMVSLYNKLTIAQYHKQAADAINIKITDKRIEVEDKMQKYLSKTKNIKPEFITQEQILEFEQNGKILVKSAEDTFGSMDNFFKVWQKGGVVRAMSSSDEKLFISSLLPDEKAYLEFIRDNQPDIKELNKLQRAYASEISKSELAFPRQDDKKGAGSGSYQRTMQEYDRMLDNYNWAKEALEQGIKMQEQIMNDETLTFEERLKAEKEYYNLKKILIKTETHKERQDAVSDFNNKVKDDNAKHQKNIESIKKNNEKAYTVTEEANNKIVQLTIDYSKKIQEAKTPEERTALREQYQKESAELSKHVIDVLGQQKSLTSEENEYLKAMAINRENLSNKTISLNIKENAELKEVFDERKENLKSIYDFEIELRNKILKSTEKQLIEENRLTGVLLSAARAQKGLEDLKNGKRIGFIDYSGLDATIDELNAFEREISALNIQLETSQSINNNYKLSLADMLGKVKAMSGGGNGALSLFQKEVEKLDESFSNGELTYSEYSEALKVLALNYLDKNKVIGDDERNLMNEIISNNEKIISSEEDVSNKKIALAIKVAEEKERLIKQVAEMEKKAYADLREGVVNVYDSILEYQDTRTENEINKIDEETEKKGELYDEQLSDLETLRDGQQMTDEEYEERRQVLEQQKQSFEEQQENRKKVLEKQMFERDKNQRMSQLLLETASALGQIHVDKQAYISTLMRRNALMGTTGAVSAQVSGNAMYLPLVLTTITSKGLALASIAASKYSAYAEGTDSVPRDEYAWVGDGGKNELMVSPSGEIAVTPNYPVLTKLKKGTRIYPDLGAINGIEAETLMRNLQLIVPEKDFDYNIFLSKFDEMIGVVKRQKTVVNIKPSLFDKASRKGLYS